VTIHRNPPNANHYQTGTAQEVEDEKQTAKEIPPPQSRKVSYTIWYHLRSILVTAF